MNTKEKYFNFPIQLLEGFMIDTRKVLNNISDYAIYESTLELEYGTELEKIREIAHFYCVILGNEENTLINGKNLYNSIPKRSPKVGLNLAIFWDFYKNNKSDFEKACLLCYLALKSIIGTKPYCKITKLYLLSRMDGKVCTVKNAELSKEVRKYATRYQTEKILNELVSNWYLVYYSQHTRGLYVSFKLDLDSLALEVEKKKKSKKIIQQRKLQSEARVRALKRLS